MKVEINALLANAFVCLPLRVKVKVLLFHCKPLGSIFVHNQQEEGKCSPDRLYLFPAKNCISENGIRFVECLEGNLLT